MENELSRIEPHTHTALAVLGICMVLNLIGRGTADTYVVFLRPLEQDLGWTRSEMTSVYSIYLLVSGLSSPIVGMLFDRFGPRALYTCGMSALAGAYLLAPQVHSLWQFYLTIGAMTGIAAAALGMVPSSSLISRWFRERLATAISACFASLGLGALVIVPGVQYLLQSHGWRDSYQIMGSVLLALVPLVFFLPWKRIARGHPEYLQLKKSGSVEGPTGPCRGHEDTHVLGLSGCSSSPRRACTRSWCRPWSIWWSRAFRPSSRLPRSAFRPCCRYSVCSAPAPSPIASARAASSA
jgi:MFS family permease